MPVFVIVVIIACFDLIAAVPCYDPKWGNTGRPHKREVATTEETVRDFEVTTVIQDEYTNNLDVDNHEIEQGEPTVQRFTRSTDLSQNKTVTDAKNKIEDSNLSVNDRPLDLPFKFTYN